MESVHLTRSLHSRLNSVQGCTIKYVLGISKRSHHSGLLSALNLPNISELINRDSVSLLHRVLKTSSPYRSLSAYFLSDYIVNSNDHNSTLVSRVLAGGVSIKDIILASNKPLCKIQNCDKNSPGLVDSLKYLIYHPSFNYRNSTEHQLAQLLTKSF